MSFFDMISNVFSSKPPDEESGDQGGSSDSPFTIEVGKSTSIGYYRDNNEDRYYVNADRNIYIVADGMGGQAAGEQASQLAVDMIPEKLEEIPAPETIKSDDMNQAVNDAVLAANSAIIARGEADPSTQNMGTTVVMAVVHHQNMIVAHVGDSRAYRLRDGKIDALTEDHNLAMALYLNKTITKEELQTHRFRHVLWKYLGSKEVGEGPDLVDFEIKKGDRFLLASDGLTGVVEDPDLKKMLEETDDPQKCAEDLVKLALDSGSKDNVTVLTLYIK